MTAAAELEDHRRFLESILGCSVALTDAPREFLATFQEANCFDIGLQPVLTQAYLVDFVTHMDKSVVHEIQEPLGMAVTVFWLGGELVVVGPYTGQGLHPGDAEALLGQLRIPSAHLQAYKLYRARFPIVDTEYVRRGAMALAELAGHGQSVVGMQRVSGTTGPITPGGGEPPHSASFEVINERYAVEQEFMNAVSEGDEERAFAALQGMSGIPQPPSYLNTPLLGATILRIMARVAAQQGGLPPVTIDAISQTHAQRLHRAGPAADVNRTSQAISSMVSEFCRHVQRHRRRPYSRLVRQVMDEISLHLSHNVSSRQIAARLHVSESHLARRFKAETGHTISEHVAQERVARAAHLLVTTAQPVSGIAAYVGYEDANYFVKVFKSVHQLTPTAYRRQHTEG